VKGRSVRLVTGTQHKISWQMKTSHNASVPLQELLTNPDYYLWRLEGSYAIFVQMTRESFQKSIFTDQRIVPVSSNLIKIRIDKLLKVFKKYDPPKISYLFHVAHCGSTLLSRAMDIIDKNIVYREPGALRQLAVMAAENDWGDAPPASWWKKFRLTTALLSKSYLNRAPVIIKANVPVNFVIDKLMQLNPETPGLLLYSTFENYLLSILKSPTHRAWSVSVLSSLAKAIKRCTGVSEYDQKQLTAPQVVACLWLAQISAYCEAAAKYENLKTVDSEIFFSDPEPVLAKTFELFNITISAQEINGIINSDLFGHYSKDPRYEYSNERRITERQVLKQSIVKELEEGRDWVMAQMDKTFLPDTLSSPLLGKAPLLLA